MVRIYSMDSPAPPILVSLPSAEEGTGRRRPVRGSMQTCFSCSARCWILDLKPPQQITFTREWGEGGGGGEEKEKGNEEAHTQHTHLAGCFFAGHGRGGGAEE
mmetsp:Transcript_9926/g.28191  ORF Transcript_9926/g.28191 Transcript_9926/m.28191 type:complete len:103 (-) Transcript_9926:86-394(-)